MTDFKEIGKNGAVNGVNVRRMIPDEIEALNQATKKLHELDALDRKTKELIYIAFAIARQCEVCIAGHVKNLIEAGGTKEELAVVVGVAGLMSGGPGLVYGGKALEAFDQFSEK